MARELKTHDGNVISGGLLNDGLVSLDAAAYGLADNTHGKVGRHVLYPDARGLATLPDAAQAAIKEHGQARYAAEIAALDDDDDDLSDLDAIMAATPTKSKVCPRCGTYCYGDCVAAG